MENFSFRYQESAQGGDPYVFQNVNFSFPMNTMVCLQGSVGCGKNTLLKVMGGLEDPVQGSFLVNGDNLFAKSESERFDYRRLLGYGFSQGGLLQNRSLRENLALALDSLTNISPEEANSRIAEYLSCFGLTEDQHRRPGLVSGGTRMATCLARALIHDPEMLVLRHPTNGLVPALEDVLKGKLKEHLEKKALRHVFLISDNPAFFGQFDHVLVNLHRDRLEVA
jgi:phospholipid/cholesterol/gamma-HCH transport system ATP-binding protein